MWWKSRLCDGKCERKDSTMIELCDAINIEKNLKLHDALHGRPKDVIAELNTVDADMKAIETDEHVKDEFVTYRVTIVR